MIAFDKVSLGVVSTSSNFSYDKGPSSLGDETPRKGLCDS